tara:strand:+ start:878 stop:2266 length:1389 start_codon:yes stop_codon:yes gene_type:complete
MVEYTHRASDASVEFVELITPAGTIDLKGSLVTFDMYESLYNKYIKVEITINDSANIPFHAPILGEEYLNFRFNTKSSGRTGEIWPGNMYTVEITDRYITKDRQQMYILHFVSQQAMHSMNSTVSRSFNAKPISDIVNDIYTDYLEDGSSNGLTVEPTLGIENVVIPNLKPLQAIDWLSKRAINKRGVPNYLFWESNGETYFKSVDTLLSEKSVQKFFYNPISNDSTKLNALSNGVIEIDELQILSGFNVAKNVSDGFYASKLVTHDIVNKKIEERTYSLDKIYNSNINHTEDFMPISEAETDFTPPERHTFAPLEKNSSNSGDNIQSFYDSNIKVYPKHNQLFSRTIGELYNNNVEDWLLQRSTLIRSLDQIRLQITCPGVAGLEVGQIIEIAVPSPQKVLKTARGNISNVGDLNDFFLSGRYLVTSLNRNINFADATTTNRYRMTIEITKSGLGSASGKR